MPVLLHSAFFLSHLRNSLLFSLAPSCFSLALFFGEARERAREEACAKRSRRRKFSERLRRKEKAGLDFHPPSSSSVFFSVSFFLFFFFFSFYFAMSDGKYFTTTKKGKLSTRSRRSVRDWIGARGRGRGRRSLRSFFVVAVIAPSIDRREEPMVSSPFLVSPVAAPSWNAFALSFGRLGELARSCLVRKERKRALEACLCFLTSPGRASEEAPAERARTLSPPFPSPFDLDLPLTPPPHAHRLFPLPLLLLPR